MNGLLGLSWVPAGHGRASPAPNAATDVSRIYSWSLRLAFPLACRKGKAVSWTLCALAIDFPPCLLGKMPSHGLCMRLHWAFHPVCRGKGGIVVLVCACDGLFARPVEGKAGPWTLRALVMDFSPCLSWKRPSPRLAMDFPLCLSLKRTSHGVGARPGRP